MMSEAHSTNHDSILNATTRTPSDLRDATLEVFGRNFVAVSGSVTASQQHGVQGAARITATLRPSVLGASVFLRFQGLECELTTFEVIDARNGQFLVQFSGHVIGSDQTQIRA
jgi:hypothetical protein